MLYLRSPELSLVPNRKADAISPQIAKGKGQGLAWFRDPRNQ